jgi:DNA-binding winged helix-turn-helix (wHTH) protein
VNDVDGLATIDLTREPSFRLGNLIITPPRRTISLPGGVEKSIEPRLLQVLVLFSQKPNLTVGRNELLARCWSGVKVSNDAVELAIRKLRKLEAELAPGSFKIITVPKVGYRLDIEECRPAGAEATKQKRRISHRDILAALGLGGLAIPAIGWSQWIAMVRNRSPRLDLVAPRRSVRDNIQQGSRQAKPTA